jgi:hypothetical protein
MPMPEICPGDLPWRLPLPASFPPETDRRYFVLVFHFRPSNLPPKQPNSHANNMAKSSTSLDWCTVRLGDDHNWWVAEVSDPVRWDVDGLSIVDPRQVAHLIELVEPLRDYGLSQEIMEAAFIPFRIEKDLGAGKIRLKRVKDLLFESDEKLFALADTIDEENGPYADLLDHITRCRVKMLNDLFNFESKLTIDEVEDELREEQNASFIEGKAVHTFDELTAILDFVPEGWDTDEERPAAKDETDALPELDEVEEEKLKNDESLKWDEDGGDEEEEPEDLEALDDDEDDDDEEADEETDGGERKSKSSKRGKR